MKCGIIILDRKVKDTLAEVFSQGTGREVPYAERRAQELTVCTTVII